MYKYTIISNNEWMIIEWTSSLGSHQGEAQQELDKRGTTLHYTTFIICYMCVWTWGTRYHSGIHLAFVKVITIVFRMQRQISPLLSRKANMYIQRTNPQIDRCATSIDTFRSSHHRAPPDRTSILSFNRKENSSHFEEDSVEIVLDTASFQQKVLMAKTKISRLR